MSKTNLSLVLLGSCQDADTYGFPTVQALQRAGNENIRFAGLLDDRPQDLYTKNLRLSWTKSAESGEYHRQ